MEFSISLKTDEDGLTGMECPKCEKYFKIKFGTGLPTATECHCPYCNHIAPQNQFFTKDQIEYAKSVAVNKIISELHKSLKKLEMKPKRNSFISIGITVKGRPTSITYYSEKDLEEKLKCNNCTLEYAIYGTFGYCPDCGIHNSLQILNKNFDLILKILSLSTSQEIEVVNKLIENSLENIISCFDGFGREYLSKMNCDISMQNIKNTRQKIIEIFKIDIFKNLDENKIQFIIEQFQKRHLFAHKMGVADEEYIKKTGLSSSIIGKKITTTEEEIKELILLLKETAIYMVENIRKE